MASIRLKTTADGVQFYEIGVSRGRGKSKIYRNWYPKGTWSGKTLERELNKAVAELENEVADGLVLSRDEKREADKAARVEAAKIITLKQYVERVFMPAITARCSEHTRESYTTNFKLHIYPALGEIKMPEVTSAEISALLYKLRAAGKSHATVVKVYTILNGLFKMAYLADAVPINPMGKVERPKPRKGEVKTSVEAFSADEVKYIFWCLDHEPLKWRAYIHLLVDTGIRRGEGCALKWKNIDFKESTATIAASLGYTKEKGIYTDTPKNGRSRVVDLSADTIALLRQLRSEQAEKALSEYVFTQDGTKDPIFPDSPTRYFAAFGKYYGVEGFHPHKLRHTFASLAITNGADVASISEILGHSDKAVTLRVYSHADAESRKRAAQVFRDAIADTGNAKQA